MAKVIAPNKEYSGISAGVVFAKGEGLCEDKRLLDWFEVRGYQVVYEEEIHGAETVQDDGQSTETSAEQKAEDEGQNIEAEVEEKEEKTPKGKPKAARKGK
ncbi:MAG: hypothetical protein KH334_00325 [Clostridiales bacterium]|nr:hypothetical protein [Clostridiales bacterium]